MHDISKQHSLKSCPYLDYKNFKVAISSIFKDPTLTFKKNN